MVSLVVSGVITIFVQVNATAEFIIIKRVDAINPTLPPQIYL